MNQAWITHLKPSRKSNRTGESGIKRHIKDVCDATTKQMGGIPSLC